MGWDELYFYPLKENLNRTFFVLNCIFQNPKFYPQPQKKKGPQTIAGIPVYVANNSPPGAYDHFSQSSFPFFPFPACSCFSWRLANNIYLPSRGKELSSFEFGDLWKTSASCVFILFYIFFLLIIITIIICPSILFSCIVCARYSCISVSLW